MIVTRRAIFGTFLFIARLHKAIVSFLSRAVECFLSPQSCAELPVNILFRQFVFSGAAKLSATEGYRPIE
jgi:hypothetical protein